MSSITFDIDEAPEIKFEEVRVAITKFDFFKGYPDRDGPPEPNEYEIEEAYILGKTMQVRVNDEFIHDLNNEHYDAVFKLLEEHRKQEEL